MPSLLGKTYKREHGRGISHSEGIHHMFLECIYSVRLWTKYASLFRFWIDMSGSDNIWITVHGTRRQQGIVGLVAPAVCWNIWRERNDWTFNNIIHTVDHYTYNSYLDFHYWAGQLSERKTVSISEDDDNYMHDISLIPEDHQRGNADWEEWSLRASCRHMLHLLLLSIHVLI